MPKGEAFQITREYLIKMGVTNITEDGRVFKGDYEMSQFKITRKHKFSDDVSYYVFQLYDPEIYQRQRQKDGSSKHPGQRIILTHRAVFAWYYGSCPKGCDIDHIDGNPFNNNINNLRAIPHRENIRQRKIQGNQFFNAKRLRAIDVYKELCEYARQIKLIPWYEKDLPCGFKEFLEEYQNYATPENFTSEIKAEMLDYVNNYKNKGV